MKKIESTGQYIIPSKVVCIGRNYVDHIKELNNELPEQAVIFVKPNSAITDVIQSNAEQPIHYEAEISFVIENNKMTEVGIGLDLTKRDLQNRLKAKGLPWERAKGFDKSAVFSQFICFDGDVKALSMQLLINGIEVQYANYDLMIHKPAEIIAEVAAFMSFTDGDILMTGTPKGVGLVIQGDQFVARLYCADNLLLEQQWTVL